LPDDFIPGESTKGGDYGRFTPEVEMFYSRPKTDLCASEFIVKTGYHFGEAE
jgi:hypothetical protein